jgi:hypothetical protein
MTRPGAGRVLYVIVCGAGPAGEVGQLVELAHDQGWTVQIIATTALPEEPILLRIYRTDGAANAQTERDFHRLLEAADHSRSVARSAGREWFVTSTRFLDEVARVLKLPVVVVNDAADVDDD